MAKNDPAYKWGEEFGKEHGDDIITFFKNLPDDAVRWANAYLKNQEKEQRAHAKVQQKIGKDKAKAGKDAWDWTKQTVQHDIPDATSAFTAGLDQNNQSGNIAGPKTPRKKP